MRRFLLLVLAFAVSGCTPTVNLRETITVTDVRTGWYDVGILEDGKNKLVPAVSLKLQNASGESVARVQLNAIFHRVGETDGWGSTLGYTGEQSRADMLRNASFVDATVDVFGKQGRGNWVKLGEFPIDRQLLTE
jgi:hypothetical protein